MNGVIYARYSSDNQREESIEGQIRECRVYAEKNDIQIVDSYIDRAYSAKTDNRPDFQKMIKDSAGHGFDVVIVWKLDRFSRDRYDAIYYKRMLQKNKVRVISATEIISDNAEGVLLESLLEGLAAYYSVDLAQKTLRGMTENALKCKSNGSAPIGYKTDKELHYVIDPLMAPVVVEAFKRYSEGATIKTIASEFAMRGIRNRKGGKLTVNTIANMLANRRYIGEYRFKDIVVPGGMPAIITEDLFERVQERRTSNKKAPAKHKAEDEYLLTTKLFCAKCKCMMAGESGTSQNGTIHNYYKCPGVKHHRGCDKKTVRKKWIEDLVIDQIKRLINDDELIDRISDMAVQIQKKESSVLPILRNELAEVEKGINNLVNAIQMGIFTAATKQRMDELELQKSELTAKIGKELAVRPVLTKDVCICWFTQFRKLDTTKLEHRRRLIDTFINAILLYDDKMIITFNYKNGTKTVMFDEIEKSGICSDSTEAGEPKRKARHSPCFSFCLLTESELTV